MPFVESVQKPDLFFKYLFPNPEIITNLTDLSYHYDLLE